MREYEVMILFDSSLPEKDINTFLEGIDGKKGVENIGVKKLAYRIKKKDTANYYVLNIASDNIENVKSYIESNSNILRYLVLRK